MVSGLATPICWTFYRNFYAFTQFIKSQAGQRPPPISSINCAFNMLKFAGRFKFFTGLSGYLFTWSPFLMVRLVPSIMVPSVLSLFFSRDYFRFRFTNFCRNAGADHVGNARLAPGNGGARWVVILATPAPNFGFFTCIPILDRVFCLTDTKWSYDNCCQISLFPRRAFSTRVVLQ